MHENITVLLVDDNPMVLGMLRQAVSQHARVETAGDGADALLKAVEKPPDLIVTDFAMPGMDGRQLLEKLKGRGLTARVPVILLASKSDVSDRLKMVQDTVEDFIEKPFFMREATERIKRVVDRIALEKMARAAPGESQVRGSLAQMNAIDLLQSLEMGHKTCALELSNDGERCRLYFADGQINHAEYGELRGDEAVYKVLRWTEGNFQIDFAGRSEKHTTTRSTQGLLMEGLRLLDEAARDEEENVLET